jgi:hypothetical protein
MGGCGLQGLQEWAVRGTEGVVECSGHVCQGLSGAIDASCNPSGYPPIIKVTADKVRKRQHNILDSLSKTGYYRIRAAIHRAKDAYSKENSTPVWATGTQERKVTKL